MLPDWLQVGLALITVIGSIFGSVVAVSFRSGSRLTAIDAAIAANAKAIEQLTGVVGQRATVEVARGLQAQIDRHDGAFASLREEVDGRAERVSTRIDRIDADRAEQSTALAGAIAELKTGLLGVQDGLKELAAAERARPPVQRMDMIAILNLAVQAAPLVRQLLASAQRVAA